MNGWIIVFGMWVVAGLLDLRELIQNKEIKLGKIEFIFTYVTLFMLLADKI